ncbi:MAG TPA: TIGR03943 family protein, partial [Actinoallomurus sp.]|nr:TIGR03943 family protein [Actinoallomurus sp.]
MTCCAADAVPMRIAITGVPAPATGRWMQVTGTWSPNWAKIHDIDTPRLTATAVRPVGSPSDPYE